MVKQKYRLNLIPDGRALKVHCSQYDAGIRTLGLKLYKGSYLFNIPEGVTARIRGAKPDGNVFEYPMTVDEESSTVSVVITEQMSVVAGDVLCEVVLFDGVTEHDANVIGSANFVLVVEPSPLDMGKMSDSDIPAIETLINGGDVGDVLSWEETGAQWTKRGTGDMSTDVYDRNKNGVVDDAEMVNGHTVARNVEADEYTNEQIDDALADKVDAEEGKGLSTNDFTDAAKNKLTDLPTKGQLDSALAGKVDKENGKGLSTNDYTNADKDKLGALPTKAQLDVELANKVDKVVGKDLSTNDFTDEAKDKLDDLPAKASLDTILAGKVDKETGKGLSTNDYTTAEKTKLTALPDAATLNADLANKANDNVVVKSVNGKTPTSGAVTVIAEDIPADGIGDETVSGNPIVIEDAMSANARGLKVTLEPVQDLHGFDKPWVGGAGKNLLYAHAVSETINGLTFTPIGDGSSFRVNGTATANVGLTINSGAKAPEHLKSGKTYTISGGHWANTNIAYVQLVYIGDTTGNTISFVSTSGAMTITLTEDATLDGIYISFRSGQTFSNDLVQPQFEEGASATLFAPYTNISPISGRTEASVFDSGHNVWDEEGEEGSIDNGTGQNATNTTGRFRSKNYIPCLPNTDYCIYNGGGQSVNTYYYDANKNYLGYVYATIISLGYAVFRTLPNAAYMRFRTEDGYGTTYNHDISVNYPSTDHDYHAYTGSSVTIQLGQEVYGGVIDVVQGVMRVTHRYETVDSSDGFTYRADGVFSKPLPASGRDDKYGEVLDSSYMSNISHVFVVPSYTPQYVQVDKLSVHTNGTTMYLRPQGGTLTSLTELNTYLTGTPVVLCYELKTPTEVQLTPETLSLLEGYNVLTSDGTIDLTYLGSVASDVQAEIDEFERRLHAVDVSVADLREDVDDTMDTLDGLNASQIPAEGVGDETVTGNPVIVNDAIEANAKALSVSIEPVQDLHGYSKPWVGGSGKNLLPMTVAGIKAANTNGTWTGNAYSWRNIVFTIETDNDGNVTGIKANGTSLTEIGNATLYLTGFLSASDYNGMIANGCPSGGSSSTYAFRIGMGNGGWATDQKDTGNGVTINAQSYTEIIPAITIFTGTSVSNLVFKPMIRLSSVTDATFEPYTNICPISGWDEVSAKREGKNQYCKVPTQFAYCTKVDASEGYAKITATADSLIGIGTQGTTSKRPADQLAKMIQVEGNTKYTFSSYISPITDETVKLYIQIFDKDGNTLKINNTPWANPETTEYSFTTPSGAMYATLNTQIMDAISGQMYEVYFQLERGETASPYEPYQGQTATVTLPQTVYGGSVDLATGVLTVDRALTVIDGGVSTVSITSIAERTNTTKFWYYNAGQASYAGVDMFQLTSDKLPTGIDVAGNDVTGIRGSSEYPYSWCLAYPNGLFEANATSILAYLNANPVTVAYKIAPETTQLTPAQLTLLNGYNILTADGAINLTYLGTMASNVQAEIDEFESATNNIRASIAFVESTTAKTSHAVGDYIILNDMLCKVIASISTGETITIGTNVQTTTLGAELKAIWAELNA